MQKRRSLALVVATAVVLAIAVGGLIGLDLRNDDASSSSSSDRAGSEAKNAPTGSSSGNAEERSGTTSKEGSESVPAPGSSAAPFTPRSSSAPTVQGGVTVVPEMPGVTASTLPGLGKQKTIPLPTWDDLPSTSVFAKGRLVAGYPARLLPRAPGGAVVSSSVSPSKDRVQVALVGMRGRHRDRVLRFYRAELARAGFTETSVAAVGGSDAAAFTRGASRVVVTLGQAEDKTYSVFATLVIGKA